MKFSNKAYKFLTIKFCSIFLFTLLYWLTEHFVERNPGEKASVYDCFFYSFITQTTVGYGIPKSITDSKSKLIKTINIIQMASIFVILALQL